MRFFIFIFFFITVCVTDSFAGYPGTCSPKLLYTKVFKTDQGHNLPWLSTGPLQVNLNNATVQIQPHDPNQNNGTNVYTVSWIFAYYENGKWNSAGTGGPFDIFGDPGFTSGEQATWSNSAGVVVSSSLPSGGCAVDGLCPPTTPGGYWPWPVNSHITKPGTENESCYVPNCTAQEVHSDLSAPLSPCVKKEVCGPDEIPFIVDGGIDCRPKPNTCTDSGKEMVNQVCVDKCADGTQRFGLDCINDCQAPNKLNAWGECKPDCGPGKVMDLVTDQCVDQCSGTKEFVNGSCVDKCDDTTKERINGVCVDKCKPNFSRVAGVCTSDCQNGEVRDVNGVCSKKCDAGQIRGADGVCKPKDCGSGYKLVGENCVQNPYPSDPNKPPLLNPDGTPKLNPDGTPAGDTQGLHPFGSNTGDTEGSNTPTADGGTGQNNPDGTLDTTMSCPAGKVCIGDGVCQAGEGEWSSDCAGEDYFEHRWERYVNESKIGDMKKIAMLGDHSFSGGNAVYTAHLPASFGGNKTFDFSEFPFMWKIMYGIFHLGFAWLSIRLIFLKR